MNEDTEYQLEIEEIASIALETNLSAIGDKLDLKDDYLIKLRDYLKIKLND